MPFSFSLKFYLYSIQIRLHFKDQKLFSLRSISLWTASALFFPVSKVDKSFRKQAKTILFRQAFPK